MEAKDDDPVELYLEEDGEFSDDCVFGATFAAAAESAELSIMEVALQTGACSSIYVVEADGDCTIEIYDLEAAGGFSDDWGFDAVALASAADPPNLLVEAAAQDDFADFMRLFEDDILRTRQRSTARSTPRRQVKEDKAPELSAPLKELYERIRDSSMRDGVMQQLQDLALAC
ncbi:hypothetical protein E2562_014372 [Oryza meyeriana var. granulata]|uniref:Uncharacterized protein n=1 Tax=Oryza meyeriana var. granulata TaxID=110450 RepID=A0A6G1C534_9ORYZ|nr:hypothetical protein E2562_014372 [Oryza meyeriana var. granulata]